MGSACNNARLRNARRIVEDSSTRPSPPSVFGHVKRAVTCVSNHHHRAFHSLTIISIVRWTQLCVDSFGVNLGDVSLSLCDSLKLHALHARMFAVRQCLHDAYIPRMIRAKSSTTQVCFICGVPACEIRGGGAPSPFTPRLTRSFVGWWGRL